MITDRQKLTNKIALYRMSSFFRLESIQSDSPDLYSPHMESTPSKKFVYTRDGSVRIFQIRFDSVWFSISNTQFDLQPRSNMISRCEVKWWIAQIGQMCGIISNTSKWNVNCTRKNCRKNCRRQAASPLVGPCIGSKHPGMYWLWTTYFPTPIVVGKYGLLVRKRSLKDADNGRVNNLTPKCAHPQCFDGRLSH